MNEAGPLLHVALLGPPVARWAGSALLIPRRQARALLYRLAATSLPVSRNQLCYLFWPDRADVEARRNLTHLLTLLRRALPRPDLLAADGEMVGLNALLVESDVSAFIRLTRTADPQARPAALAAALELYRSPFLDGFGLVGCPEFETWLDAERQAWERRVDDVLAGVIEAHTVARDYSAAMALARQALARDPLAEELHRRLIVLYAATGDRTAALRQFEQCVLVLERELGVSPLPETRAVYESVRDGVSPLPLAAAPRSSAVGTEPAPQLNTIPVAPTPLIGRAAVLAEVLTLLHRADVRVLTLAGPGGAGKTRLALEVAQIVHEQYADGVTFVPLAPLRDAALVPQAIVVALGLGERDDRPPLLRLKDLLRQRELLLVLDNCEHVLDAAPTLAELLAAAPGVTILSTSRALLRIAGEQTYVVPALDLPDAAQLPAVTELAQIGAVALFLARVRERVPSFALTTTNADDIAAICAHLDGLPLAIELAAARVALLSPRMLRARLDRRLTLLIDGPRDLPERQRTLRATIDWSYALLDMSEQLLLGRLAVFAGGWTLQAAEQISATVGPLAVSVLDGMHALLNKSLIQRTAASDGEPRFSMLETIREYALERLTERGEAEMAQVAHASYYVALAELSERELRGSHQRAWLDRLDAEYDNIRAALGWALAQEDAVVAQRLAGSLGWFWDMRGYASEALRWLDAALALPGSSAVAPGLRAKVLWNLGAFYFHTLGNHGTARGLLDEALLLFRTTGDQPGIADTLHSLGWVMLYTNEVEQAYANFAESVAIWRTTHETWGLAYSLWGLGAAVMRDSIGAARPILEESVTLFRALSDTTQLADSLNLLGLIAGAEGDNAQAIRLLEEGLALGRELKNRYLVARLLSSLADMVRKQGDYQRAAVLYRESLGIAVAAEQREVIAWSLQGLAGFASVIGHPERAVRLVSAAAALLAAGGLTATIWPLSHVDVARTADAARLQLGEAAFAAAYAAGQVLTLDEAVAEALRV